MGFNFGGTPAPPPAPGAAAPAPGGFSLGGNAPTPAAAPPAAASTASASTASVAGSAPSTGGFTSNFGTASTAPATGTGFGTTATSAAPVAFGGAPAPSATGFGAAAASTNSNNAPTNPASTFGASTSFGFGATATSTPATAPTTAPTATTTTTNSLANLVQATDFDTQYPNLAKTLAPRLVVSHAMQTNIDLSVLLKPKLPDWEQPNPQIRQQLASQMTCALGGKEAGLTPQMLHKVLQLADDLRISETTALGLIARDNPVQAYLEQRQAYFRVMWQVIAGRLANEWWLEASDQLLQDGWIRNLVDFVRLASQRIRELHNALHQHPGPLLTERNREILTWHLAELVHERQVCVESLFLLAYHTQFKVDEVVLLVDLIQHLTNEELPKWDPLKNIPSLYAAADTSTGSWTGQHEHHAAAAAAGHFYPGSSMAPLKDPLEWKAELVKQAKPAALLLRTISTLVVTVLAALETQSVLWDRQTHGENAFGKGNALLPPGSCSFDSLAPIDERFSDTAKEKWQRDDILGMLMASYAMLLRSCPVALTSPRNGPVNAAGSIDVRKSWREGIEAPTECKSFSFARLSLLPALQQSTQDSNNGVVDVSEFLLATVAEFASQYLHVLSVSSDRPISRAKWEQAAEENLKLQREDLQNQQQFHAMYGTTSDIKNSVPEAVNLLDRPDCMDDVIAFCTAVCSLGPDYALTFWSKEEQTDESGNTVLTLVPSRSLLRIRSQQAEDETLRASYLSFLAALAIAKTDDLNGASAIFELLSHGNAQDNWQAILTILRWFATELDPNSTSSSGARSGMSQDNSSAYYYFEQDGSSSYGQVGSDGSSGSKRELGEENTYLLMAHLELIINVARGHAAARSEILFMNMSTRSTESSHEAQDTTLMFLFSLAVAAVAPEVRGKVFRTMAELLRLDFAANDVQIAQFHEAAGKTWEMLEACQILPIYLLEQYPSQKLEMQSIRGLSFPPSSTVLVGSNRIKTWFRADSRYAIVYEMEHVESATGVYPSTMGFLSLLKSLFTMGICPSNLGSSWRLRAGCTPYIEYVMYLVLPRVAGKFKGFPALPFRSAQDQMAMAALACEVLETVLARHCALSPSRDGTASTAAMFKEHFDFARKMLGHSDLSSDVFVEPLSDEGVPVYQDFGCSPRADWDTPSNVTNNAYPSGASSTLASNGTGTDGIPPAKSPGLTIIAEMLSPLDSVLFESIVSVLESISTSPEGILSSDDYSLAHALFVATPPSFEVAKEASRLSPSHIFQNIPIDIIRPKRNAPTGSDDLIWKERTAVSILRLLCAVFVREDIIAKAVSSTGHLKVVPIIRFQGEGRTASQLKVINMNLTRLSQRIASVDTASALVTTLISLVSFRGSSNEISLSISTAATAVVFYIERSLGAQKGFDLLCCPRDGRNEKLAQSFGLQLMLCAEQQSRRQSAELIYLVLEKFLQELRKSKSDDASMVHTILGLPTKASDGTVITADCPRPQDYLDAVLRLLQKESFEFQENNAHLGSACYELVFRLCGWTQGGSLGNRRVQYAMKRLRPIEFWELHLQRAVVRAIRATQADVFHTMHLVHALSWILKGTAAELVLLGGLSPAPSAHGGLIDWQPTQYKHLLSFLLNPRYNLIADIVSIVPMERPIHLSLGIVPTQEAIRISKYDLPGAPEIVKGYELVDGEKMSIASKRNDSSADENSLRSWADQWNRLATRDCAASHLSHALYEVLGCAGIANKVLGSHHPKDQGPWLSILSSILSRMELAPGRAEHYDEAFFTTSTRNLSLALLMVSNILASSKVGPELLFPACVQISRLIAQAGDAATGPGGTRKAERIAILAKALSCLLQTLSVDQSRDFENFLEASTVMSRLATKSSGPPEADAIICRSCLSTLFHLFAESDPGNGFCRAVLTSEAERGSSHLIADSLIAMVPSLRDDITPLLLTIVDGNGGAQVLIERGILRALGSAAVKYLEEENIELTSRSASHSYQSVEINTPHFLAGHIRLLSSLMVSAGAGSSHIKGVSDGVSSILKLYGPIFERLVTKFPVDGDVLQLAVKCYTMLCVSIGGESRGLALSLVHSGKTPLDRDDFDLRISSLAMHIAENPVPRSLQKALPSLIDQPCEPKERIVSMASGSKTWWNGLQVGTDAASLDETCRYASLGLDTVRDSLMIIRRSKRCNEDIDVLQILRALCRCMDASKWVAQASTQDPSNAWHSEESTRYPSSFRSKLFNTIEELLVLALTRVRQLKAGTGASPAETYLSYAQPVRAALDYMSLGSSGFSSMPSAMSRDENWLDNIRILSTSLRREFESSEHQSGNPMSVMFQPST